VYSAGSNGNVAPVVTIGGSNTRLSGLYGVALDGAGNIYASSQPASSRVGRPGIYEFSNGSNGNVNPTGILSGKKALLTYPSGIAIR
jgi:hypothetical protein